MDGDIVLISDINGLSRPNSLEVSITPEMIPPRMFQALDLDSLDSITSFLLGEIIFELLLGSKASEFYACIQAQDDCVEASKRLLRNHLAPRLSLSNPIVRDMAAMGLVLTGYAGASIGLAELKFLPSVVLLQTS